MLTCQLSATPGPHEVAPVGAGRQLRDVPAD